MSATKSVLKETDIFAAKIIHHEEISKYSTYNITNFTNPLDSNIESGSDTSNFKEDISQHDRLEFVEDMLMKMTITGP